MKRSEKVAFQGEKGAFSQMAVQQFLGPKVEVAPCHRFEEVFLKPTLGSFTAAALPIVNTTPVSFFAYS